jgi:hypothetical protein
MHERVFQSLSCHSLPGFTQQYKKQSQDTTRPDSAMLGLQAKPLRAKPITR